MTQPQHQSFQPRSPTIAIVTVLLLGCALLAVQPAVSPDGARTGAVGEPTATAWFTETVNDTAIDSDANGNYDLLELTIGVEVATADEYNVYATLAASDIDARGYAAAYLTPGTHTLTIQLGGKPIYDSGRDGPYTVSLLLSNHAILDRTMHTTAAYDAGAFNPAAPELPQPNGSTVRISKETITITGEIFTTVIDIHHATLLFDYSPSLATTTTDIDTDTDRDAEDADDADASPLKYQLRFTQLVGFDDTDDGWLGPDDTPTFTADLAGAHWTLDVRMIEGFDYFEFEISTVVAAVDTDGNALGEVRVAFHLSSAVIGAKYSVQKFDIELLPSTPLPGSHIALEQELTDETGTHRLYPLSGTDRSVPDDVVDQLANGAEPVTVIDDATPLAATTHSAQYPTDEDGTGRLGFVGEDGTVHGYYEWLGSVQVRSASATTEHTFSSSYQYDDDARATVAFCYPNPGAAQLYHDPSIGVVAANAPLDAITAVADAIVHNPLVFALGLGTAIATVYLTLALGARRKR